MKKTLGILFALAMPAMGQTLYLYPGANLSVPQGTTQTVTAVITGVNDKTVSWTSDGGTLRGATVCAVNEPCTIGLYSATPGTIHLTATSNASGTVHQTIAITYTATPTPTTGHPRIYITSAMVAGLRTKFTAGSPMATAIKNLAASYYAEDNANWSWGGAGACGGTHSPVGSPDSFMERHITYYALMGMIDPTDSTYNWNCYAHDTSMWYMGLFNAGIATPGEDQWRNDSFDFAVMSDWLLGSGAVSTTADVNVVRGYVYNALRYTVTGTFGAVAWLPPNSSTNDMSTYNALAALGGAVARVRTMGNNYALARNTLLVGLSLTFDDNNTDDPPPSNTCSASRTTVCPDWTAGSRHAFFNYFTSVYLYGDYAHLEDPNVSWQALQAKYANLPTQPTCANWQGEGEVGPGQVPCFGDGRDGESSEGSGYGFSVGSLRQALNMVWTAGYNDPLTWGPQMSLVTSSWWDLHGVEDLEFLSGQEPKNGNLGGTSPAFAFINTGDTNTYYRFPGWFGTASGTLVFDSYIGRTDRTAMLEWPVLNSAFGGPDGTAEGCSDNCGFNSSLSNDFGSGISIDMFLALPSGDPVTSPPADPRPNIPTDLYNGSFNQHLMIRNGWTGGNANSYVDFQCSNALIDHEHPTCGRYQVYSGNEYITKSRTEFDDYNALMSSATQANMLSIMNNGTSCATAACVYYWSYASGGDWWHGLQQAAPTYTHSELPAYAAVVANTTGVFNGWGDNSNVTGSSQSWLYLRGSNRIVTYYRAATGSSNPKSVQVNTTGAPTITANQATWLTRSGNQKAAYTTILPASGTLTAVKLPQQIYLTGPHQQLQNGTTMQMACTLFYADGTSADVSSSVAWVSDNPAVATVNSTGLVTAVGLGDSNLHCYWNGNSIVATNPMNSYGDLTVAASSSGTFSGAVNDFQPKDWEPYTSLKVAPPSNTTSTQFLNMLEWGSSGMFPSGVSLVQSSAGQGFDCAFIQEQILACFMRTWPATFTGTTYSASGATTQYISDLSPNTTYSISATGAPAAATTDNAGVLTFATTGTGSIVLSPGGTPPAVTPTFSPVAGTYSTSQTVTISTISAGAIICYNTTGAPATNGTTGCAAGSTLYSGPLAVSISETVYAVAGGTSYVDSPVGSAAYVIRTAAATPTFSPVAGSYAGTQTVTISTTAGSVICYNTTGSPVTNGSTGCTNGTLYTAPVTVSSTRTLYAVAGGSIYNDSSIGSAAYVINGGAAAPTYSPVAGTYTGTQTVTLSTSSSGCAASIVWNTTNAQSGGNLTGTTTGTSVTVSASETVYSQVQGCSGFSNSVINSAAYVINTAPVGNPVITGAGSTIAGSFAIQ